MVSSIFVLLLSVLESSSCLFVASFLLGRLFAVCMLYFVLQLSLFVACRCVSCALGPFVLTLTHHPRLEMFCVKEK